MNIENLKHYNTVYNIYNNDNSLNILKTLFSNNNIVFENELKDRIFKFNKFLSLKPKINNNVLEYYSVKQHFDILKITNEKILNFWQKSTILTINQNLINFPFCFTVCNNNENLLYFLKNKEYEELVFDKKILFQKLIIFYYLFNQNLIADKYFYNYIDLKKKTNFTYKIKDLLFNIELEKILILSNKTELRIYDNNDFSDYLYNVTKYENDFLKTIYNNIFKVLLEKFEEFFFLDYLNFKSIDQIIIYSKSIDYDNLYIGKMCIIKKENKINYYVVTDMSEHFIKGYIFFEKGINKLNNFFKIEYIINKQDEDNLKIYDLDIVSPNSLNYLITLPFM